MVERIKKRKALEAEFTEFTERLGQDHHETTVSNSSGNTRNGKSRKSGAAAR